jgi:hypothetical protein
MKRGYSFMLVLACLAGVSPDSLLFGKEQNQFLRVTAELSSEGIRLIETRISSGKVRAPRLSPLENVDPYLVRVFGNQDEILFEATFRDPRSIHYDALDFEGKLTGGVVRMEKGVFTFKIPYSESIRRLDILERSFTNEDESVQRITAEKPIGSFTREDVRHALAPR